MFLYLRAKVLEIRVLAIKYLEVMNKLYISEFATIPLGKDPGIRLKLFFH